MPIQNTQGSFNTGRDSQIVLVGPFGRVDLNNVTGFTSKQETATIKVDRLDGVQLNGELPKGWTGSFDLERGDANVDLLIAQIEAAWQDSGSYQVATLYQYITEVNGRTTLQFDNVALKLDDAGTWKGDASVKQRVSFMANRRRSI